MRGARLLWTTVFCATATYGQQSLSFQDWEVDLGRTYAEATTRNESGSIFGFICADKACRFYFSTENDCDHGDQYPVMLNSSAGAMNMQVKCDTKLIKGQSIFFFVSDDNLVETVVKSDAVGFAMPLKSGRFAVSRFSARGFAAAAKHVTDAVIARDDGKNGDTKI